MRIRGEKVAIQSADPKQRRRRSAAARDLGASMVEYVLLVAFVALVAFAAVTFFGQSTASKLSTINVNMPS